MGWQVWMDRSLDTDVTVTIQEKHLQVIPHTEHPAPELPRSVNKSCTTINVPTPALEKSKADALITKSDLTPRYTSKVTKNSWVTVKKNSLEFPGQTGVV